MLEQFILINVSLPLVYHAYISLPDNIFIHYFPFVLETDSSHERILTMFSNRQLFVVLVLYFSQYVKEEEFVRRYAC